MGTPHRWRELLGLIDELPSACRLREAIFNDPLEAARIVAADEAARERELGNALGQADDEDDTDQAPSWRPRDSEWDVAAIQRASIHGVLVGMSSKIAQPKGWRSPPAAAFLPAPRTLVDELKDDLERTAYEDALDVFYPQGKT